MLHFLLLLSVINLSYESELSYSKEWANSQLRFGIKLLKGQVCSQNLERAISDAVSIRWALANAGFWWQAKRLDNWINRARQKEDFLSSEARVGERAYKPHAEGEFTRRSRDPEQREGDVSRE